MNKLLKWSITNSDASKDAEDAGNAVDSSKNNITPELISKLFGGGPSDAQLMEAALEVVNDPETDLENKLVAFDNFEQLIEGIDNANNLEPLGLWPRLVQLLKHEETEIRRMAAWSVGTAVQNNPKTQAQVCSLSSCRQPIIHFNANIHQFLGQSAIPDLVTIAITDTNQATRKKAVYALSSAVRNYQPALDALLDSLPEDYDTEKTKKVNASVMEEVDVIIEKLRAHPVDASA